MIIDKSRIVLLCAAVLLFVTAGLSRADCDWADSWPFDVNLLGIPSGEGSTGWADSEPFGVNLLSIPSGEGSTGWADSNDFNVDLSNMDRAWADSNDFPAYFADIFVFAKFISGNFTGNGYTFTVRYIDKDNNAIDVSRLDSNDIRVAGPNSFEQLAEFVDVNGSEPNTVVARYNITAPGGSWDPCDDSFYTLFTEPNQISDTAGNFVPAGILQTFAITENSAGEFVLENYNVLSTTRVGRTIFEYIFTVTLRNAGSRPASRVEFELFDVPSNMTIVDSNIVFTKIPAGQSATSNGFLKVRIDRSMTTGLYDIPWRVTFEPGRLVGDFTGDGVVDLKDVKWLADVWLTDEPTADIAPIPNGDGIVNFLDFAVLAEHWLKGI
jgi:hypothetical protein